MSVFIVAMFIENSLAVIITELSGSELVHAIYQLSIP